MLKVQFKDKRQDPFWVMEKNFSLGSASNNTVVIADPSVSSSHAKIVVRDDRFLLRDLDSAHGTFINGKRIAERQIHFGDTLGLGSVELEVVDPIQHYDGASFWLLIADSSWISGQEFPIGGNIGQVVTVGRSSDCNIVLAGAHLSRVHAEITINDNSLTIKDMGSANGTFINDKQITCAEAFAEDRVRLDVYGFRIFNARQAREKPSPVFAENIDHSIIKETPKRWRLKPTSPGNRVEHDLYKKQYVPTLLVLLVVSGLAAAISYVIWGITVGG